LLTLNSRILLAHKALLHFRNTNCASLLLDNLFFMACIKVLLRCIIICAMYLMYGTDVHKTVSRDPRPRILYLQSRDDITAVTS